MRISDWSSDVWLFRSLLAISSWPTSEIRRIAVRDSVCERNEHTVHRLLGLLSGKTPDFDGARSLFAEESYYWALTPVDRKSVVSGKSVSVRVVIGGRRIINKKTTKSILYNN